MGSKRDKRKKTSTNKAKDKRKVESCLILMLVGRPAIVLIERDLNRKKQSVNKNS